MRCASFARRSSAASKKENPFTTGRGSRTSGPACPASPAYIFVSSCYSVGVRMSDVRIIAVSLEGGEQLEHLTHVWTTDGAMLKQRAVEDLWSGRHRYFLVLPTGRLDVAPVPARGPNVISAMFGRRIQGDLESPRGATLMDGLLTLPRLPSPTRPRRSRAMAAGAI